MTRHTFFPLGKGENVIGPFDHVNFVIAFVVLQARLTWLRKSFLINRIESVPLTENQQDRAL